MEEDDEGFLGCVLTNPPDLATSLKKGKAVIDDNMMLIFLSLDMNSLLAINNLLKARKRWFKYFATTTTPEKLAKVVKIAYEIDPTNLTRYVTDYVIITLMRIHGGIYLSGVTQRNKDGTEAHALIIVGARSKYVKGDHVDNKAVFEEIVWPFIRRIREEIESK